MTIPQLTDEAVKVALLSAKCRSGLVVHTLSKHFGLSIDDAEVLMKRGSGTIAKRISARLANETKPLLLALGLKIAILPVGAEADEHLCDVFIRVTNAERASPVIRVLRRHLELDPACLERFGRTLVVEIVGLTEAKAGKIVTAIRQFSDIKIAVSTQLTADYDLYTHAALDRHTRTEIRRHAVLIGAELGGMGDALAFSVDRDALARLKRCFPKAGLFGVDRKFQQYELLVAGNCALSPAEFADFLTTRTGTRFSLAQVPTAADPLPVETGLTYANAEQFFRDYSAIGLKMIVRLVRPQPD